ncbi:MAG: hypothetical protein NVSMB32_16880 [Actinomycetota bacterium]
MSTLARRSATKVLLVLIVVIGGFVVLQGPTRDLEAAGVAWVLRPVSAGRPPVAVGPVIVAFPSHGLAFSALVTPACSVLASVLALGCLAGLTFRGPERSRLTAFVAALTAVVLGNLVRMAGSIWIGTVGGRAALVMFHDWIGAVFTFAYTLLGYVLMLYLMLPARESGRVLS